MDVKQRLFGALLLLLFATSVGCQNAKTSDNVFTDSTQNKASGSDCSSESVAAMGNSFLVQWEDGTVTVEKSENKELFKEKFVKPNLEKIRFVEHDRWVHLDNQSVQIQSSSDAPPNWGQGMIRASAAWAQGVKGKGVTVAIVDTPVDYTHPQLKSQMVPGWDFVTDSPTADAPHSHATHIAGVIGGAEGGQVQGLAPEAKMMGVSFMDSSGQGSLGLAIEALKYSAAHGAKIINNSWGGDACSLTMKNIMKGMEAQGVLLLVAAGNDNRDIGVLPEYPAAFNLTGQITVAASNQYDHMASFSNDSYTLVHLAAPGDSIFSAVPFTKETPTGYAFMSGTSMATPFVSGAAALLLSVKPNATPAQLRQALLNSVDIATYRVLTQGRLNIEKAIQEIKKLVP